VTYVKRCVWLVACVRRYIPKTIPIYARLLVVAIHVAHMGLQP